MKRLLCLVVTLCAVNSVHADQTIRLLQQTLQPGLGKLPRIKRAIRPYADRPYEIVERYATDDIRT